MSNCGSCDAGLPHYHEHIHPSVNLYNAMSFPAAAVWWRDRAKESAQEANQLREELRTIKDSRAYRFAKWLIRRVD